MTSEDYRSALAAAIKEYEALGEQRREIDERLSQLAQTIGTLSRLLGLTPTVPLSITDAVRLAMRSGVPMTPLDVRERLLAIGVDLSAYSNDLAVIHTVLKRPQRGGRAADDSQALRQERLPVGEAGARDGARTGDRRLHARPAARARLRRSIDGKAAVRLPGGRNDDAGRSGGVSTPKRSRRSRSSDRRAGRRARRGAARTVPAARPLDGHGGVGLHRHVSRRKRG